MYQIQSCKVICQHLLIPSHLAGEEGGKGKNSSRVLRGAMPQHTCLAYSVGAGEFKKEQISQTNLMIQRLRGSPPARARPALAGRWRDAAARRLSWKGAHT